MKGTGVSSQRRGEQNRCRCRRGGSFKRRQARSTPGRRTRVEVKESCNQHSASVGFVDVLRERNTSSAIDDKPKERNIRPGPPRHGRQVQGITLPAEKRERKGSQTANKPLRRMRCQTRWQRRMQETEYSPRWKRREQNSPITRNT